ncbi:hypothetical protein [Methanolobus psychrotolerans]|uniref:hypothetical protein n=1 Tax=Methanolobus psychrotolerans TaxID=1874706 RepID=UPI000B919A3C|nr:hypothetical protein [Methanolobus psychrotolerans]
MKKLRSYENRELFVLVADQISKGTHFANEIRETISYIGTKKEFSAALSMMVRRKLLKSSLVHQSNRKSYHLDKMGIRLLSDIDAGYKKVGRGNYQNNAVFNVNCDGSSEINIPTCDLIGLINVDIDNDKDTLIAELQKQLSERDKQIEYLYDNPPQEIKISMPVGRTPLPISKPVKQKTRKLRDIRIDIAHRYYKNKLYLNQYFFKTWENVIPARSKTINMHGKVSYTNELRIMQMNHEDFKLNLAEQIIDDRKILDLELKITKVESTYIRINDKHNSEYKMYFNGKNLNY